MTTNKTRDRSLGAVIGSAVGDALGAPFEFGRAGEYRLRFPSPVLGDRGEMIGGGPWMPAEFTDDTQMAIVQATSLIACDGINGEHLFESFRTWSRQAADVGLQTRAVLGSGLSWDTAAAEHFRANPTRAAGNGSVMRSAASAVYFSTLSLTDSMEAARELAAITHGDPAAGWGTAIFHALIHVALRGGEPMSELQGILEQLPSEQHRYLEMLAPDWCPGHTELPNGSVWTCLAQAVWAVRNTSSFEDAMVAAIDLGDDTDTVAAVAGGLAGATYGIQQIPSRWTTYLNGTVNTSDGLNNYRLADLQRLTLALLDESAPGEAHVASASGPTEIADLVHVANLAGASATPEDWAVVSLCRVGDRFAHHPVRRELFMIDKSSGENQSLAAAVRDAVDAIDVFRNEGRRVVVHCHAGASRTGLVIRAWLMHSHGLSLEEATASVAQRWPLLDATTNVSFAKFLRDEWPAMFTESKEAS